MFNRLLPAIVLAMSTVQTAHAAESSPATAVQSSAIDEEEQLDEGLKRFGYLAGLARGCVVESQRVDLLKGALVGAAVVGVAAAIANSNDD